MEAELTHAPKNRVAGPAPDRWLAPAAMPIPSRLTALLDAEVVCAAVALLWLGSRVEAWYAVLGVGVAFSYVLLTNYDLLHEATYVNLHALPRWNYVLGVLL